MGNGTRVFSFKGDNLAESILCVESLQLDFFEKEKGFSIVYIK